ncbi:MAG: MBOAT family protein [Planctomycetota bacterium]
MTFSSIEFLFYFLPVVMAVYAVATNRLRNLWLLGASCFFYLFGGGWAIGLLAAVIAVNWLLGMAVARMAGRMRRFGVAAAIVANLGLLGAFKFLDQIVFLAASSGLIAPQISSVALPIGLSFFTFQAMSYVIDVATGRAQPLRSPLQFAVYIAMFPQLVAGPIVRFHEIEHQLARRSLTYDSVSDGAQRFAWGLIKKVLIADSVAPLADWAFLDPDRLTTPEAWVGLAAYSIQIYFDFSGYSDMAIGLGQMFGFRLPENFKRPYAARSVTDFWRRWHVTLSYWFRDYVYIPMGGNRGTAARTGLNLLVVFLATGLWHGAGWTFIVWGLYHGVWLILERVAGWRDRAQRGWAWIGRGATLLIVMLGWVFFRADSLPDAADYLAALFGAAEAAEWGRMPMDHRCWAALAVGCVVFVLPGTLSVGQRLDRDGGPNLWVRLAVCCVLLPYALSIVVAETYSPFLYFRF